MGEENPVTGAALEPESAEAFANTTPRFWTIAVSQGGKAPWAASYYAFAEAYAAKLRATVSDLTAKLEDVHTIVGGKCGTCGVDMNEICGLRATVEELR